MTRMSKAGKREQNRLSAKGIAALKAPGRYPDGGGLYLQVSPSGTKSWLFRFERDGRERMFGLGSFRTFSLQEAREGARKARQQVQYGTDPIEAKRQRREDARREAALRVTFREAAERYIEENEASWKSPVHRAQWRQTLREYCYPKIGTMSVASIGRADVLQCLTPIWTTKNATASRLRARIENILNWAVANGYREKGENPAAWDILKHALPKVAKSAKKHHAAMPYKDLPAFMVELRTRGGVAARALEFTILTALRTGEVLNATRSEIDFEERVWTIPASRMKAEVEHKVPLAPRVLEILTDLPSEANNPYVFVGDRPLHPLHGRSLFCLLRRDLGSGLTVHGFRSSFSDWAHERASTDNFTIEMALAHKVGNAVTQAYLRSTLFAKRRNLMEAWSAFCGGETEAANVVQFNKAG
jgi:integrase